MNDYIPSPEEAEYLKNYDPGNYPRPSVTADVLFFCGETEKKLLLIRRGGFPYRGWWALPGGFCNPGESPEAAAARELLEETGVSAAGLSLLGAFGEGGRDPRGWTVTCAYLAAGAVLPSVSAADDAADAKWFSAEREKLSSDTEKTLWRIKLSCGETELSADVEEYAFSAGLPELGFRIVSRNGIAFDHAKIIAAALSRLDRERT